MTAGNLDYSLLTGDSLAVATAYKGLGSVYMEMRKTAKAMRYLGEANLYFANHEDEELQFRMESLDYTNAEIAAAMCLSPETIKWYKKKLFAMFDAANSAELIKIATEKKVL